MTKVFRGRISTGAKLSASALALGAAASTCSTPLLAAEAVPGVAAGWPIVLRGAVCGTPIVADIDGDGKSEIISPAMMRSWDRDMASTETTPAAQLWAFHSDGKSVDGWPMTLKSAGEREAAQKDKEQAAYVDNWYVSPSAWDVDGDGASEIIINTTSKAAEGKADQAALGNIAVLYGDGGRVAVGQGGDAWASVPLADVDGDGAPDIVLSDVLSSVRGKPIAGWPQERKLRMAYQPAMGDADGDGRAEVFMPFYERDWHLPGQPENRTIGGFSATGEPLPGWPIKLPQMAIYVVMGDIAGDEKKEIIAVDWGKNLRAWNLDGTPVRLAPEAKSPRAQTLANGSFTAGAEGDVVLATDQGAFAPPALADLDGDGKAEILTIGGSQSVYAFRGDGRPFLSIPRPKDEPLPRLSIPSTDGKGYRLLDPEVPEDRDRLEARDARQRRGRIAILPFLNARAHCGLSVVDLGGDGVMDIFAGTHWIRLAKDGSTQLTNMVPAPEPKAAPKPEQDETTPAQRAMMDKINAERAKEGKPPAVFFNPRSMMRGTPRGPINDAGCSVADVDADGQAEVVFGLSDGRLFLYRTGMSLKPKDAQWPTWAGNFQHTGVWAAAK